MINCHLSVTKFLLNILCKLAVTRQTVCTMNGDIFVSRLSYNTKCGRLYTVMSVSGEIYGSESPNQMIGGILDRSVRPWVRLSERMSVSSVKLFIYAGNIVRI